MKKILILFKSISVMDYQVEISSYQSWKQNKKNIWYKMKNVVGYEIPFTRYFYKYQAPKPSAQIMDEIKELEKELAGSLTEIFGE